MRAVSIAESSPSLMAIHKRVLPLLAVVLTPRISLETHAQWLIQIGEGQAGVSGYRLLEGLAFVF